MPWCQLLRLNPDVLVIDISMPVLESRLQAALTASLHAKQPTKIVFLTVHTDRDLWNSAALCAGALGYVTKSDLGTDACSSLFSKCSQDGFTFHSR